jgi:hypothetical protein
LVRVSAKCISHVGDLKHSPVTVHTAQSVSNEATYKGDEEPRFVQRFQQACVDMVGYFARCVSEDLQPGPDGKAALQIALRNGNSEDPRTDRFGLNILNT